MRRALAVAVAVALWPSPGAAQPAPTEPVAPPAPEAKDAKDKKDKRKKPKVSGFMQIHFRKTFYTSTDNMVDATNFRVQRVRLAVEGDVLPWLSYDVSIDPRAPEVGGVLRDAYVTAKVIPRHRIRVGQQKTQFGYENDESSTRLYAVNRTEVSDNLSRGVTLRDIGLGVLGHWPLGHGLRIEDAVTLTNGARSNAQMDDTKTKNVWGRLGLRYRRDCLTVRLGVSGGRGDFIDSGDDPADPADDFRVEFKRLGTDLQIDHPWVLATAEYVWGRDHTAFDDADDAGYYVNVVGKNAYNAVPVGPIVRYDVMGDEFQRWTFGAYYGEADARLRVLVNYEYRRLKDAVRGDDRLYVWTQVKF